MKEVIWKYELKVANEQYLTLPYDYKILSLQMQYDIENDKMKPYIWVLFDKDDLPAKCQIKILMYGTGHLLDSDYKHEYLGTVIDGHFVWHYFNASY